MRKIYQLKDQKISDKYMTGLSKIFDDRLFYVYYVDCNMFKFKITFRRYLFGRTFFEWAFDRDFYAIIGEGEIKWFDKNMVNYLEINMHLSPILKIVFIMGVLGIVISPILPVAIFFALPLIFIFPYLIVWIIANFTARSQINLICKIA